jgi:hypothetical protein
VFYDDAKKSEEISLLASLKTYQNKSNQPLD